MDDIRLLNRDLTPDLLAELEAFPLFAPLPPAIRARVLDHASAIQIAAEDTLFNAGERPDHLFVVVRGEIGLTGTDEAGDLTVVEILRPGAAFIEAAVMTDQPYLMGARALRPSLLLRLPADNVRADVARWPELASAMVVSLSAHFRLMVNEIKDLKLKTAGQRLGLYLLELAGQADGAARVVLPHSKGLIAARIGIRRETLSRVFGALKSEGVTLKGPTIFIEDVARLRQFCSH